jgi:hypothetical protein
MDQVEPGIMKKERLTTWQRKKYGKPKEMGPINERLLPALQVNHNQQTEHPFQTAHYVIRRLRVTIQEAANCLPVFHLLRSGMSFLHRCHRYPHQSTTSSTLSARRLMRQAPRKFGWNFDDE